MNPSISTLLITPVLVQPANLGSYASSFDKSGGQVLLDPNGASDPVDELRLQDARNSK